jgi:hypothetical protein
MLKEIHNTIQCSPKKWKGKKYFPIHSIKLTFHWYQKKTEMEQVREIYRLIPLINIIKILNKIVSSKIQKSIEKNI